MNTANLQLAGKQGVSVRVHRPLARRILSWVMRGVLGFVILLTALVLSGITFESIMAGSDNTRFPAPGQMIEIEGHTMHIRCVGTGSPTIVFESGFGEWSDSWVLVQPEVAKFTRACSYDRAGLGWSEIASKPRTQDQIAIELRELLAAANIQPPYILVGHSIAGKSIRLFAARYSADVAGLVFVDARHESMEPVGQTPEQNARAAEAYESSLNLYRVLRQTGIVRLFGVPLSHSFDPSLIALPDEVVYRLAMFGVRETVLQTMIAEGKGSLTNDEQLRSEKLPDALPIFVLTADSSLKAPQAPSLKASQTWEAAQQKIVALSSNSKWLIVQHTGHNIQINQPQTVTDAIRAVVEAARTGKPLAQ